VATTVGATTTAGSVPVRGALAGGRERPLITAPVSECHTEGLTSGHTENRTLGTRLIHLILDRPEAEPRTHILEVGTARER